MGEVGKDLISGTAGGAAQLVFGHPFDTIKVKLQSQAGPRPGHPSNYSGAIHAARHTFSSEGLSGFFKGMGVPLATVAAFNALLFAARGQMEHLLRSQPGQVLSVREQILCGMGAGLTVSFLACPTELVKCRLQAQGVLSGSGPGYSGPMDVVKRVVGSEGGVRSLFKGFVPTMVREIPGNAALFGSYEAVKRMLAGGEETSRLGRGSLMAAGGLAGASFWLLVYPADVVKSVIQVDDHRNPKYYGTVDALRKIVKGEGVRGLYKGFTPAMVRSVPANAVCFLVYELVRSGLG